MVSLVAAPAGTGVPAAPATVPPQLRGPTAFILYYLRKHTGQFCLVVAVVGAASICAVGVQYGMKLLVDVMTQGSKGHDAVWMPLFLFIGLIAAENTLWRISGWLGCRTVVASGVEVRSDLFDYLCGQPMRYFDDHLSGALGGRVTAAAGAFGALSSKLIWNTLPPCIDFIGAVVIFLTVDWRMAVALCLFVAMLAVGLVQLGVRGRPFHLAYAEKGGRVAGELVDTVSNIWAVKAFSARGRELDRLRAEFAVEADAHRRSWLYLERTRGTHDVALSLMAGSMLAWAIYGWTQGTITPGEVVVVSALTFRILYSSRDLAMALIDITQQFALITETVRVIGQPQTMVDQPGAQSFRSLKGSIEFRAASFAYADGRKVFDQLLLRIPAGQKVGIVGPSGAGKSTLLALVQRLEDVQHGSVLVDGQDVRTLRQDELRAAIAVVPQVVGLFHRSVMDNIRYGRPTASDEEVSAAARVARCDEFIAALPLGYATPVGERGVKLSGGQRQRVGLARAILKGAPILVLDEATSALDTVSELEVQQRLERAVRGRTVIAVAHRLSTVMGFDRILVLEEGRIVEDGRPSELRHAKGAFERPWRLQTDDTGEVEGKMRIHAV